MYVKVSHGASKRNALAPYPPQHSSPVRQFHAHEGATRASRLRSANASQSQMKHVLYVHIQTHTCLFWMCSWRDEGKGNTYGRWHLLLCKGLWFQDDGCLRRKWRNEKHSHNPIFSQASCSRPSAWTETRKLVSRSWAATVVWKMLYMVRLVLRTVKVKGILLSLISFLIISPTTVLLITAIS